MKTGTTRKATPRNVESPELYADHQSAWVTWIVVGSGQTVEAVLVNTVSGWVETQTGPQTAATLYFTTVCTVGQTYAVRIRQFEAGEPSAWFVTNTMVISA
jgi:hypothetical protein